MFNAIGFTAGAISILSPEQTSDIPNPLWSNTLATLHSLQTACAITIAFVICWTPYAILSVWITFRPLKDVPVVVLMVPAFFAKSSASYNPIIYFMFNKSFRREVCTFLCCCACQCYTLTLNIDNNDSAKERLVQVQTKRENQGRARGFPVFVCGRPFAMPCPWGLCSRAADAERQHRSAIQEVNAVFSRNQDRIRFTYPLTDDASLLTLPNDGNLRRRRSGMMADLPVSESTLAVPVPSAPREPVTYVPNNQGKPGEDPRRHHNVSNLHAEFLDPNAASQSVRIIVVNPNIDNDPSSD